MPALLPKDKLIIPDIRFARLRFGPRRAETDWTILGEAIYWFILMVLIGGVIVVVLGGTLAGGSPTTSPDTRIVLNLLVVGLHVVMFVMWCGISYFRPLWEVRKRMFAIMTVCYIVLMVLYSSVGQVF